MNDFFSKKLQELKDKNLYRQLQNSDAVGAIEIKKVGKKYINFSSNDYLGLAHDPRVIKSAQNALKKYGFGAGASRYVSGNNSLYFKLEKKLAQLKNSDDAIIFGSGYLAAIGVIPAIMNRDDLIIADKLIHSCLIDGAKLSGAKLLRFKHNDILACEEILQRQRGNYQKCLIITETVFSMDGDLGEIDRLAELAVKYNSFLLSDDAHGLGIIKAKSIDSKTGSKFSSPSFHLNSLSKIHLQMGTLSKAAGGYGGYICASKIIIDYLRNFARPAIYTTALPAAVLAGNLKSIEIIAKDNKLAKKAIANANYFCRLLDLPASPSIIVVIIIGEAKKTLEISQRIAEAGFLVAAIRPPTVEVGKSRLRVTFSALHKKAEIKKLAKLIKLNLKN